VGIIGFKCLDRVTVVRRVDVISFVYCKIGWIGFVSLDEKVDVYVFEY